MFITSALSKNDMKGMALQMAMEMMHKDGGKDVITGLKTRTQPGRPKWAKVRYEDGATLYVIWGRNWDLLPRVKEYSYFRWYG